MTIGSDLIKKLYDLGHFNNPDNPTGITLADIPCVALNDAETRIALASFRDAMALDFDRISLEKFGRKATSAAEIEQVTELLFAVSRCGFPDHSPDVMQATGSGSWPSGCLAKWPANHAITIKFLNPAPSWLSSSLDAIFARVREAYADMGLVLERDDAASRAHVTAQFTGLAGSTIGLTQVLNQSSCNQTLWSRFDYTYQPGDLFNQWARLLAHEWGHAMGYGHTRGGIMNPSIVSGPFTSKAWRGDPSESILRRSFGGVPVDLGGTPPVDPPVDPPPTGVRKLFFTGSFGLKDDVGNDYGDFILVPKPRV